MSNYWVKDMEENGFNHEKVISMIKSYRRKRDDGIFELRLLRDGRVYFEW